MPHVSLLTLGVDDLAASTAFYEALGWHRSSASIDGEVAFMTGGNVALGLYDRRALAADARVAVTERGFGTIALAMNLPTVDDVDRAFATARDAGARVTRPPEHTDWGGYAGYFADRDGHLWEVAFNPGFPLAADGRVELP